MSRNHSDPDQQPCSHCGECARACPESLDPQALFFALVGKEGQGFPPRALGACSECNRCAEVCPSHIPLLDWFRWGKAEIAIRHRAELARARFLARNARLAREHQERAARRKQAPGAASRPVQSISKAQVLAAIARGRAKREAVRASRNAALPEDVVNASRKP